MWHGRRTLGNAQVEMEIRRLGYALGAEVVGLDLRRPLPDATIAAVRAAWLEHLVLCFRDADIEPQEMVAFCGRFGELDDNRLAHFRRRPASPNLIMVASQVVDMDGKSYNAVRADKWHSDYSYTNRPATAAFLLAKQLPDVGGDTQFCNMYTAYDTLSPAMQALIAPLEAVHDVDMRASVGLEKPEAAAERRRLNPPIVHPVVRVHPETGRKTLYVGERIRHFVGMTEEETRPLLDFLNRHATRYEFVYRHRWSPHDLLMWDNRCLMHYAIRDFDLSQLRRMERCSLLAPKSGYFYEPATSELSGAAT